MEFFNFKGKTVLVTGASQGIGREIAKQMARRQAKVIASARNAEALKSLRDEEPSIEILPMDLTRWDETEKALENVGHIDLLVNNAGMGFLDSLVNVTEEMFDEVFAINIKAMINITRLVVKNLLKRKVPGSIVNVSSQASLVGLVNHSVYCASKGAVDGFTRACALEYGPKNIRVNAVNPTVIMTDMGKLGWSDPAVSGPMLQKIPLRRFGQVHEVVDAVMFLLSDRASMITGHCLPVDGGYVSS